MAGAISPRGLLWHISWTHGNINGNHMAPVVNYTDNTWAPLGTTSRQLWAQLRKLGDNLATLFFYQFIRRESDDMSTCKPLSLEQG